MEKFKGTPGPWVVDANGLQARWNIDDANGNSVALTHQLSVDKDWQKRDANTHLIAAAPELLEALQRCESVLSNIPLETCDVEDLLYARAAIKKALGE